MTDTPYYLEKLGATVRVGDRGCGITLKSGGALRHPGQSGHRVNATEPRSRRRRTNQNDVRAYRYRATAFEEKKDMRRAELDRATARRIEAKN